MAYGVRAVQKHIAILVLLLCLFGLLLSASAHAETHKTTSTTLPITYYYDLMTVPIHINGEGPYDFIIDTGATASVLFSDISKELNIVQNGEAVKNIHGINAMEERPQLELTHFKAGSFLLASIKPIEAAAWTDKGRPAGIIGTDILSNYGIIFDPEIKEITITTPETFEEKLMPSWKKVKIKSAPYGNKSDYNLLFLRLKIDGTDSFSAMLDTGSQISMINRKAANSLFAGYRISNGRKTWVHRDVLSETYVNKFLLVDRVNIGRNKWKKVNFLIKDMTALEILGTKKRPLLIAGMDLMKDRKFAINFPENRLYISEPLEINGTNLSSQSWAYSNTSQEDDPAKRGL